MASQSVSIDNDNSDFVAGIVNDLGHALERLDMIGFTEAGARLATVIDWLNANVSDASESGQATQS